jgi:hypothetical protein
VSVIRNVSNPMVSWINITAVPDRDDRVFVDWLPVAGAAAYLLEIAYKDLDNPSNPLIWNQVGSYNSSPVQLSVNAGTLRVRVAPFSLNGNVRYTTSAEFVAGSNIAVPSAPIPADPQTAFSGLTATPRWNVVTNSYGYNVEVRATDGTTVLRTIPAGTDTLIVYDNDMMLEDSPSTRYRTFHFYVTAFNGGGSSTPAIIILTNPLPVNDVSAFTVGTPSGTNYPCTWTHTQEVDHRDYQVFTSTTDGFTAGPGNLLATVTTKGHTIPAPTRPLYVRIGIRDVWGDNYLLSAQQVIP